MLKIIVLRAITGACVIFFVVTMTFFLLRVLPGGPFDEEKQIPPSILKNIEKKYGLDKPLWQQYLSYMSNLLEGDFGPSYKYEGRSASEIIKETFPVSFQLGVVSFVLAVLVGVGVGVLSAAFPKGAFDFASAAISTSLVSVPSFVVGAFLIYLFSVKLGMFPAALWGKTEHFVLPSLTLASGPAAYIARLVRANMLDVSSKPYVCAAYAKGVGRWKVLLRHMLSNALIPVVTVLGPVLAYLVTGSFVVEHIFAIPGMGRFFVFAVSNRDYSVVLAITIVYTVILVFANLLVDISYRFLDPRVKYGCGE